MTTHDANARSLRITARCSTALDEELELEIDDDRLAKLLAETPEQHEADAIVVTSISGAVSPPRRAGETAGWVQSRSSRSW